MNPDTADNMLPLTAALRDALNLVVLDTIQWQQEGGTAEEVGRYATAAGNQVILKAISRLESALTALAAQAGAQLDPRLGEPIPFDRPPLQG